MCGKLSYPLCHFVVQNVLALSTPPSLSVSAEMVPFGFFSPFFSSELAHSIEGWNGSIESSCGIEACAIIGLAILIDKANIALPCNNRRNFMGFLSSLSQPYTSLHRNANMCASNKDKVDKNAHTFVH